MLTQKTNIGEDLLLHHQTSSSSRSKKLHLWPRPAQPRLHPTQNHIGAKVDMSIFNQ